MGSDAGIQDQDFIQAYYLRMKREQRRVDKVVELADRLCSDDEKFLDGYGNALDCAVEKWGESSGSRETGVCSGLTAILETLCRPEIQRVQDLWESYSDAHRFLLYGRESGRMKRIEDECTRLAKECAASEGLFRQA